MYYEFFEIFLFYIFFIISPAGATCDGIRLPMSNLITQDLNTPRIYYIYHYLSETVINELIYTGCINSISVSYWKMNHCIVIKPIFQENSFCCGCVVYRWQYALQRRKLNNVPKYFTLIESVFVCNYFYNYSSVVRTFLLILKIITIILRSGCRTCDILSIHCHVFV